SSSHAKDHGSGEDDDGNRRVTAGHPASLEKPGGGGARGRRIATGGQRGAAPGQAGAPRMGSGDRDRPPRRHHPPGPAARPLSGREETGKERPTMTRFALNVERIKRKQAPPERLSLSKQVIGALKERLPPDACCFSSVRDAPDIVVCHQ